MIEKKTYKQSSSRGSCTDSLSIVFLRIKCWFLETTHPNSLKKKTTHFRSVAELVETWLYFMGLYPSTRGKTTFINQEVSCEHSTRNRAEPLGTQMSERSSASDFNSFMGFQNEAAKIAEQWFKKVNALSTEIHNLKKQTEQLTKDNQSLRQR